MNQITDQHIENLILFIAKEPSITVRTRRDFLQHIMKGGVDEKSLTFISKHLERLNKEANVRLQQAQNKQNLYQQALFNESIPEVSAKKQIIDRTEVRMDALVEDFKTSFRAHEKDVAVKAETAEETQSQIHIDALKAQL